jgi:hypothetical protein
MDEKDLRKAAREQGWEIGQTSKGHTRWVPPDKTKPIVVGSGTPGDQRAIKNLLAQLRRSGFIWPWPPSKARDEDHEELER